MMLRSKLLLAQLPLIAALVLIAILGRHYVGGLGRSSERILQDNYRSVLAAQAMKACAENLDRAHLFALAGDAAAAHELGQGQQGRFETELSVQEGNLTEHGELAATNALRQAWQAFLGQAELFGMQGSSPSQQAFYFEHLWPAFKAVTVAADGILVMNQDAMLRKSDQASQLARRSLTALLAVSLVGLLAGIYASRVLTDRLLRPLSVLGQTARRIGEGDLAVRAMVERRDEIADLAGEFNAMAARLQQYRQSSLGELLESQRVAQTTIDSLMDPVLVIAFDGHILQVNRAAEEILAVRAEGDLHTLNPALRELLERICRPVSGGGGAYQPKGLEEAVSLATRAGERSFLPRATALQAGSAGLGGTTVVLQDVTRFLRIEELRNDLVATVAHEFRTPLTSLRMAIHLLTEQAVGPLNTKQADLVYAAREDCERLDANITELLDLSRIQAGKMELRLVPVEVLELGRSALGTQSTLALRLGVGLVNEILPGLGVVHVDQERMRLALANLLQNALRHSPVGAVVSLRAVSESDSIRLEVVDRGAGIAREAQATLFEKYCQVPGATGGTAGLGLYLVKEIVRAHGGTVGVDSELGAGSTFWVRLPRGHEPAARIEPEAVPRS